MPGRTTSTPGTAASTARMTGSKRGGRGRRRRAARRARCSVPGLRGSGCRGRPRAVGPTRSSRTPGPSPPRRRAARVGTRRHERRRSPASPGTRARSCGWAAARAAPRRGRRRRPGHAPGRSRRHRHGPHDPPVIVLDARAARDTRETEPPAATEPPPGSATGATVAARTTPSAAGRSSSALIGRTAPARPVAVTVARRSVRWPCPCPMPLHVDAVTRSVTSAPGHEPRATRAPPRCRNRAESRATSPGTTRPSGRVRTIWATSAIAAVTASHWSPGSGTRTSRSRSIPAAAAASTPKDGTPTTAHHAPAAEAACSMVIRAAPTRAPRTCPRRGSPRRAAAVRARTPWGARRCRPGWTPCPRPGTAAT